MNSIAATFRVLKDIYWDNWGTDVCVARKNEIVKGTLNLPFNSARPWEYASITVKWGNKEISDFASQDEVQPIMV